MKNLFYKFLLIIFLSSLSFAIDYYVSPSGSNSNPGTKEKPWKTIQYGVDSLRPGDRLFIMKGTYEENILIHTSGKENGFIIISSLENQKVTLNGDIEFARGVCYIEIYNINIQNFPGWGVFFRGENHHIKLYGLKINGGESGIVLTYGYSGENPREGPVSDIEIINSTVSNCLYTGVDCTPGPCDRIKLINLEIYGCGLSGGASFGADGIAVEKGKNIIVEACYIHDNAGDGIDLNSRDSEGNVSGIVVRRNRVVRNYLNGIKLWAGGRIENNILWGQGNTPLVIGDYPGKYEVINNTIAYNMWDPSYSIRNYSFVAAYPDNTGKSSTIDLILINNIFAFNTGPELGSPTGIYLGEGVNLVREGYNLFWSRENGEIQAGENWFGRKEILDGTWAKWSKQGKGDIASDPKFVSPWPDVDLHLNSESPAIDAGTSQDAPSVDNMCMVRPAGKGVDIGAYEHNSTLDPECGSSFKRKKKGTQRR